MLKRIVQAKYDFPTEVSGLSEDSTGMGKVLYHWKDLVSLFLKNRSTERIGFQRNGVEDILEHGWFENIDFNELRDHGVPGPWLPAVKNPFDKPSDYKKDEAPDVFADELSDQDQAVFEGF